MRLSRILKGIGLVAFVAFFSGCKTKALTKFNEEYAGGNYVKALEISKEESKGLKDEESILWNLQSASVERDLGHYKDSNVDFKKSEEGFISFLNESTTENIGEYLQQLLLNDLFTDYEGNVAEYIQLGTYRALNEAAMGDMDKAEKFFKDSSENQQRVVERYQEKINRETEKVKKALAKKDEEKDNQEKSETDSKEKQVNYTEAAAKVGKSPELKKLEDEYQSSVAMIKAYQGYKNPFTSYMSGLFYLLGREDWQVARDHFHQAHLLNDKKNSFIGKDWLRADKGIVPDNKAWVIFENGLCAHKTEFRVDLPIGLLSKWIKVTERLKYVGMALPKFTPREEAYKCLSVKDGEKSCKTATFCEVDSLLKSEFDMAYPTIRNREIARAVIKTVTQYYTNRLIDEKVGVWGGELLKYGTGGIQMVSTAADVRSWTALPKNYQVATVSIPKDREISFSTSASKQYSVSIPECKNAIVFVKIPSAGIEPKINIIKFN